MSIQAQLIFPNLVNLPAELLLEAISLVPYTPSSTKSLRLVCRRFDTIMQNYEHSIAESLVRNNFPDHYLRRFHGLSQQHGGATYATVNELYHRLQTVRGIEKNCHDINERTGKQIGWMRTRWIQVQGVGLLLLYRLCDCGKPFPDLVCSVF